MPGASYFRGFAWPWTTLLTPTQFNQLSGPPEQVGTVLFLIVAIVALFRLPSPAYGLFALAIMAPALFTGTLTSVLRYNMMALAVLIMLGRWGRYRHVDRLIQISFFALQVLFVAAWSQFYWVTCSANVSSPATSKDILGASCANHLIRGDLVRDHQPILAAADSGLDMD